LVTDEKATPIRSRGDVPGNKGKAALRRLAEHGATSKKIAAVSGHKTLAEIERYTQQANQQRLARAASERYRTIVRNKLILPSC
jgi:hypothetical protein